MPTATTAAPTATIAQIAIIPTGKPEAVTPCEDGCTTTSCTTIVEMPKEFVTFRVTWYVPDAVYCFDVCHPAPYVPSPKSQWYTREPIRAQPPVAVNVGGMSAVEVWSPTASGSTAQVRVAAKTWLPRGPASVALPPSPNVRSYRTIRPSESFDADASKTRGVPTFPKARAVVKFAVGGM